MYIMKKFAKLQAKNRVIVFFLEHLLGYSIQICGSGAPQ